MPPPSQHRIVLASTSRYRRAVLDQLGLEHVAAAPDCEEDHSVGSCPADMVVILARAKAQSLAAQHPGDIIIGCDQTAELDGEILKKPGTVARAVEQLLALSGRTHRLLSAVALHEPGGRTIHELIITHMTMRPLSRGLALAYVERDRPLDCCGSYRVEASGIALFEAMAGVDHSAIVGLPVTALGRLLASVGEDLLARCLSC